MDLQARSKKMCYDLFRSFVTILKEKYEGVNNELIALKENSEVQEETIQRLRHKVLDLEKEKKELEFVIRNLEKDLQLNEKIREIKESALGESTKIILGVLEVVAKNVAHSSFVVKQDVVPAGGSTSESEQFDLDGEISGIRDNLFTVLKNEASVKENGTYEDNDFIKDGVLVSLEEGVFSEITQYGNLLQQHDQCFCTAISICSRNESNSRVVFAYLNQYLETCYKVIEDNVTAWMELKTLNNFSNTWFFLLFLYSLILPRNLVIRHLHTSMCSIHKSFVNQDDKSQLVKVDPDLSKLIKSIISLKEAPSLQDAKQFYEQFFVNEEVKKIFCEVLSVSNDNGETA